ncbi:hypothetical protein FRD01_01440 [Microvenator marinus]|uniref:SPOR domain-containing protein n=1 Tax=Microvenator marinus TaxID=2600177 RepID=A0A5B8XK73_9DELT|nr:SPOR domain-containing protein [Microvenator marinus]QED25944.1 hypothetical protein FRD01_01440 [Microvenator marinus]
MSQKKKSAEGTFSRYLKWTVLLALVFSAGLIAGHRLLKSDSAPPLVSLSSTRSVPLEVKRADAPVEELKTEFSFYKSLTSDVAEVEIPTMPMEKVVKATGLKLAKIEVSEALEFEIAPAKTEHAEIVEVQEAPPVEVAPVEVAPVEVAPVEVAPPVEIAAPKYTLQAALHSSRAAATRDLQRFRALGLDAHLISATEGGSKVYRVRVGAFSDQSEADALRAKLEQENEISAIVVGI